MSSGGIIPSEAVLKGEAPNGIVLDGVAVKVVVVPADEPVVGVAVAC